MCLIDDLDVILADKVAFNPNTTNQPTELKALTDDRNMCSKIEINLGKGGKHAKRRKCWLSAFSPFPIRFLKSFFHQGH